MSIYIKDPKGHPQACIIWMHGLGADAQDMAGLAEQLTITANIRHVFIDAPIRTVSLNNNLPMRAWYDLMGLDFNVPEDKKGILESEETIRQLIDTQIKDGFTSQQIFLAGFSQGGAIALFTGLRMQVPLGGVIGLSTYLPLYTECNISLDIKTPIFVAWGQYDPILPPLWSQKTCDFISAHGFSDITLKDYPMEHSVCTDEIHDLSMWLSNRVGKLILEKGAHS